MSSRGYAYVGHAQLPWEREEEHSEHGPVNKDDYKTWKELLNVSNSSWLYIGSIWTDQSGYVVYVDGIDIRPTRAMLRGVSWNCSHHATRSDER